MSGFRILPAIDLKDGRCVRLRQGRAEDQTVYSDDPVAMARRWRDEGAEFLHVVDLDGAFQGRPVHLEIVRRIVAEAGVALEIGGGLRTDDDIARALAAGAARVILGTRACAAPGEVRRLAALHGDRLAVGIDARKGLVQVRGWTETSEVRAVDLARRMDEIGVRVLIVTDTGRDGMMQGTNVDAMAAVCEAVSCQVIASGGVCSPSDVRKLVALGCPNLGGAIVGKALYDGAVTLREMLDAAR